MVYIIKVQWIRFLDEINNRNLWLVSVWVVVLVWNVKVMIFFSFLQDVLQQFVVMRLPNTATICRDPESGWYRQSIL